MKQKNAKLNLIKKAKSLGAVYTNTHTCSFIRLINNARTAFIHNILKDNV